MQRHIPTLQRGATLVIGMIMLVLVTLFVLAAINMSTMNLRVMGNQQTRNEAVAAAQQAIEQVTSTDFTKAPVAVTVAVDVNGDGTTDYSAVVAVPVCLNSIPVKLTELSATDPNDTACFGSAVAGAAGIVGASGAGNSFCSNTQWEVNATVTDAATSSGTSVKLHQGVGKRVATGASVC